MVRGKVVLKRTEKTSREVTFSKRRNGLLKKAYELSVLCDVEVALIIFSKKGKVLEFSSSNMQNTKEKYREHFKEDENCNPEIEVHTEEQLKHEAAIIQQKVEQLEATQRKFLGQDTVSCSLDEICELESKLEHTLATIMERKAQLFKEQTETLKAKERYLSEENARLNQESTTLCQKLDGIPPNHYTRQKDVIPCSQSSQSPDVETHLSHKSLI